GRSPDPKAATALAAPPILADRELAYHALLALARSPAQNAGPLTFGLMSGNVKTLAARAYIVRALVRGERNAAADGVVFGLVHSRASGERALGAFANVALGHTSVEAFLDDADARVRRAAAMGTLARPRGEAEQTEHAVLARLRKE